MDKDKIVTVEKPQPKSSYCVSGVKDARDLLVNASVWSCLQLFVARLHLHAASASPHIKYVFRNCKRGFYVSHSLQLSFLFVLSLIGLHDRNVTHHRKINAKKKCLQGQMIPLELQVSASMMCSPVLVSFS